MQKDIKNSGSRMSLDTLSLASSKSKPSMYASTIWSLKNESTSKKIPRLNDQQWVMQRKKIGLSRKIKTPKQKMGKNSKSKVNIVSFVSKNFMRKECVNYAPDPGGTKVSTRPNP